MSTNTEITRCPWCGDDPLYVTYHDTEWGLPQHNDKRLFEKLCLEGQQAGLSWITVLKKRENYRHAFFDFDIARVAQMSDADIDAQMQNAGLIRHRGKLSAIRDNAIAALKLIKAEGSLNDYFWRHVDFKTQHNKVTDYRQGDAQTPLSLQISKDLKKRGFRFVGPTTIYSFMQATGMVNDHEVSCFRYKAIKAL